MIKKKLGPEFCSGWFSVRERTQKPQALLTKAMPSQLLLKRGEVWESKYSVTSPCDKNHFSLSLTCPQNGADLVLNNQTAKDEPQFVRCDADGPMLTLICTTKASLTRTYTLSENLAQSLLSKPLARYYIKGVGGLSKKQVAHLMSKYGQVTATFMFDNHRKSPSHGSSAIVVILLSSPPEKTI